jgi:hypothetical protein
MQDDNLYAAPRSRVADTTREAPSPRLKRWFHRSFLTSFGLVFLTFNLFHGKDVWVFLTSALFLLAAIVIQLACMTMIASRLGKNGALWLAGAILFAPFGYLIAYSRLTSMLNEADEEKVAGPDSIAQP